MRTSTLMILAFLCALIPASALLLLTQEPTPKTRCGELAEIAVRAHEEHYMMDGQIDENTAVDLQIHAQNYWDSLPDE